MFKIEFYEDVKGEWRWRLVARNGRVVADSSESYTRREKCEQTAIAIFEDGTIKGLPV